MRFSKDKTPYDTHVGIYFKHAEARRTPAPGVGLHLGPEGVFLGAGLWAPDTKTLGRIRDAIVADPKAWGRVRAKLEPRDDRLVRPPRGYPADHPCVEDLKLKSFVVETERKASAMHSAGFADEAGEFFLSARPLLRYLCKALDVPS